MEMRAARLKTVLQHIEEALVESQQQEEPSAQAAAKANTTPRGGQDVRVIIGTSHMAAKDPSLTSRITRLINRAYTVAHRGECGDGEEIERIDDDDVSHRLSMGDAGPRANRVLHLAYRGDELVGCCSSTKQLPWADEGVGQWGLLSVAPEAMGSGVASALVREAEARLEPDCEEIQIEYNYTHGCSFSQRLMDWYEKKCGFECQSGRPRGRGSEFRVCRKQIRTAAAMAAKRRKLEAMREAVQRQLNAIEEGLAQRAASAGCGGGSSDSSGEAPGAAAHVDDEPGQMSDASSSKMSSVTNEKMSEASSEKMSETFSEKMSNAGDGERDSDVDGTEDAVPGRGGACDQGIDGGAGVGGSDDGSDGGDDGATDAKDVPVEEDGTANTDSTVQAGAENKLIDTEPTEALLHAEVILYGLVRRPSLNGERGKVVSYSRKNGRYAVRLNRAGEKGASLGVLATNLRRA
mmetsp:Transcript_39581/g.83052  ORF Transcript_39581/g.83052 Transcript_39581/m.83052 type:complete len:464 (+) Transcript_39581:299-1690(+)